MGPSSFGSATTPQRSRPSTHPRRRRSSRQPTQHKILLRLFIHFHGNKVILLLRGYDKGGNDSPRQQNKEIKEARKRLAHWKAAEAKRGKSQRKPK